MTTIDSHGRLRRHLAYMAPERLSGRCDERSDVYALGLTLFELIALRPAFDISDRIALINLISKSEPQKLKTLVRKVPRDLETIVMKAIDRDPRTRYRSAKAVADDLERYLHRSTDQGAAASVAERMVRWSRRNRSLAATIAAACLMAV